MRMVDSMLAAMLVAMAALGCRARLLGLGPADSAEIHI